MEDKIFRYTNIILFILVLAIGLLMAGGGIPLILDKVAPNDSYGVKVAKTLNDEAIWYQANRFCGWSFLIVGCVQIAAGVFALVNIKKFENWVGLVIAIGGLWLPFIAAVSTLIYVSTL